MLYSYIFVCVEIEGKIEHSFIYQLGFPKFETFLVFNLQFWVWCVIA